MYQNTVSVAAALSTYILKYLLKNSHTLTLALTLTDSRGKKQKSSTHCSNTPGELRP